MKLSFFLCFKQMKMSNAHLGFEVFKYVEVCGTFVVECRAHVNLHVTTRLSRLDQGHVGGKERHRALSRKGESRADSHTKVTIARQQSNYCYYAGGVRHLGAPLLIGGGGHTGDCVLGRRWGLDCLCSRASLVNWSVWLHGVQRDPHIRLAVDKSIKQPPPTLCPSYHQSMMTLNVCVVMRVQ